MRPRRPLFSCVLLSSAMLVADAALVMPTHAVTPQEVLPDKAMEARARDISAGLRCLVCQNQSIDDSDAPLAHDLRVLVRERLKAGDSDTEVRDFVVTRYGDFVLLKPPFSAQTALLWFMPLLVLAGAVVALWSAFQSMRRSHPPASGETQAVQSRLSREEQDALDALLRNEENQPKS
jgi:cytochrome c-type biogenesis protein CcmH